MYILSVFRPASFIAGVILLIFTAGAEELEVKFSFEAAEAHQGVAIDINCAYVIDNRQIGKYNRLTGEHIKSWEAPVALKLIHMNAGIVKDGKIYCAHSNYPMIPMQSSIEIFDTETLKHIGRHEFGKTDGSLTWVDWHNNSWWACFAHYSKLGGDLDKGHEDTRFVQFDSDWKIIKEWQFPEEVLDRFAPYSCSGGSWGRDDELLVTGHHVPEMYKLKLPESGNTLEYMATIKIPFPGQAIDYNPEVQRLLYGISRKEKKVIALFLPDLTN